jgi:probable O-glycosylation ligase (exosortase A-associated)
MRDLVVVLSILLTLPYCFFRPYVGVLVWSWIGYMNPHRLAWGFAYALPLAQVVALTTLTGFFLSLTKGSLRPAPFTRETLLLVLLWVMFTITTIFAMYPDDAWAMWQRVSKIFVMTVGMTLLVIDDRHKFRQLCLVIVFSLGFYGFSGGVFSLLTGGEWRVYGPPDTFIEDSNALGLALNMTLPFIFYLGRDEPRLWVKRLLWLLFPFTIVTIIFTYSRGAFLGLAVTLSLLFFDLDWKKKAGFALIATLMLPVVVSLIPAKWFERQETIQTYEEDLSAVARLNAWTLAWRLAQDRPFTGGGFEAPEHKSLYDVYYPDSPTRADVHSVYFEVMAENGFISLGIFVLLLGSSIISAWRVKRRWRGIESRRWLYNYGCIFQTALIAYGVCGAFLELASFDFYYHLVALVIILKGLSRQEWVVWTRERAAARAAAAPAWQRRVQPAQAAIG